MVQVLHVYKEVELLKTSQQQPIVILAYDEKPGIQAIDNVSADLPPVSGKHPTVTRDYEYRRLGSRFFVSFDGPA